MTKAAKTEFTINTTQLNLSPNKRFCFVDVETNGLTPEATVLEIGLRLTDLKFKELARFTQLVHPVELTRKTVSEYKDSQSTFIQSMHSRNGLWRDLEDQILNKEDRNLDYARDKLMYWCRANDLSGLDPLCGSSVKADYDWLMNSIFSGQPSMMNKYFHYRVIDISSLKEIVRRTWGGKYVFENKHKDHRVQSDIDATILELKHYFEFIGMPFLENGARE